MTQLVLSALTLLTVAATPPDIEQAAVAAGVEPIDLEGAVNTTGLDPWEYLYQVGHLARPRPPAAAARNVWDRVAACESGGRWHINTGNGFYGGLQFTLGSWRAAGGSGMPHHASRETQIAVAERLLTMQGWRAWPTCSRRLGLR